MDVILVIGRVLFALIFVNSGAMHLKNAEAMSGYTAYKGVPQPKLANALSGIVMLLGGLSVALGVFADLGALLLTLTLLLSFTGYLLPWDQLALWAVTVGTNMMGYSPLVGSQVRFVLLGGVEIGSETLLRWYVLHVIMFPFIIIIFMAIHFWRVRKDGGISGPL